MKTNTHTIFGRIASALVATFVLAVLMPHAHAQGGVPLWTNRYNGLFQTSDEHMAVDNSGNVFVTATSLNSAGWPAYVATIKYSNAGVPAWTNRYTGPYNWFSPTKVFAQAVAVDGQGNAYVTAYTYNDTHEVDYRATIKYSSSGVALWTNRYSIGPDAANYPNAFAVDSSGNVFVTGSSTGNSGHYEYATIKYSNAGAPLWTNRYHGPSNRDDWAGAAAVDSSGNVFVTGSSIGNSGDSDYATIKYSNDGGPLWTNRYNGPANTNDGAIAMAVDGSGSALVTGVSTGNSGYQEHATIKYSNAGVPLWTNRYHGPANGDNWAGAAAVDSSGNVFVTGSSTGNSGYSDYTIIKYSNAGVPLWTNLYHGPGNGDDLARAAVVDSSGNVFVTGNSIGNSGDYDYAMVAYSSAGVPLGTNRYSQYGPTSTNDYATAIALDSSGNVFITGHSLNDGHWGIATVKFSSIVPPPVHLAIKHDGSGGMFLRFTGAHNVTYLLQRAARVTGPWSDVATNTAPASGLIEYHETSPLPGHAFYRAVQP